MESAPPSDPQCVTRTLEGDPAAFELLVSRYERRVFAFALRRMGNRQDAEDLTVMVFTRVHRQLHRYRPEFAFSTWLFRVLRNEAASYWRRHKPGPELPEPEGMAEGPDRDLIRREREEAVWREARSHLNAEQFDAIWLKYGEQMSTAEIARELDKSPEAAKVLLHRARKILTQRLSGLPRCPETGMMELTYE